MCLIRRVVVRAAFPGENPQWETAPWDHQLTAPPGRSVHYLGTALRTLGRERLHDVTFTFLTSPFRRCMVSIPLCVSHDADVEVRVNGVLLKETTLAPAGSASAPQITRVERDVTDAAAGTQLSSVRLRLVYRGSSGGRATVPLEDGDHGAGPRIQQEWVGRDAMRALLLYALLLAVVVTGCMTFSAWGLLSVLRQAAQQFAVLYQGLTIAGVILGVATIIKSAVGWNALRSAYGYVAVRRGTGRGVILRAGLVLLLAAFCIVPTQAYICLHDRGRYAQLIAQYLASNDRDDAPLREAFQSVPERIEAQALLLNHFARESNVAHEPAPSGTSSIQNEAGYLAGVAADPRIRQGLQRAHSRWRYVVLRPVGTGWRDPYLWHAEILPFTAPTPPGRTRSAHAQDVRDLIGRLKDSLKELSSRPPWDGPVDRQDAKWLAWRYRLEIADYRRELAADPDARRKTKQEYADLCAEVRAEIRAAGDPLPGPAQASHLLQECYDALMQQDLSPPHPDAAQALRDARCVLDLRRARRSQRQHGRDLPPWLRPPGRLMLYNYLAKNVTGEIADPDAVVHLRAQLLSDPLYKDYAQKRPWLENTYREAATSDSPAPAIRLLEKGWRY